jgi:hypothetical protein
MKVTFKGSFPMLNQSSNEPGNPESKPTFQEALFAAAQAQLSELAPLEVCGAVSLSKRETWGAVLARHLMLLASVDGVAQREIREFTEGPLGKGKRLSQSATPLEGGRSNCSQN